MQKNDLPDLIIDGASARVDAAPAVVVIEPVECSAAGARLAARRHGQVAPVPVGVGGRVGAAQLLEVGGRLRRVLGEVSERLRSAGERLLLLVRPVVVVVVATWVLIVIYLLANGFERCAFFG
jgi:hypothetical protein